MTIKPYGERKQTYKWPNRRIEYESGVEQVQKVTVNPIVVWELKFTGNKQTMDDLTDFFNVHSGGATAFYWTDSEGTTHTVRFASDELALTEKYGGKPDGSIGIVGFETTLSIRKVW